jgi:hypothetical protein
MVKHKVTTSHNIKHQGTMQSLMSFTAVLKIILLICLEFNIP